MSGPLQVIVISDYICPWCYIGGRRLEQLEERYELDVQWWPFELHPETPVEGVRVETLIERRGQAYSEHRERLKAYAAEAGLPLASNRVVANSHRALETAEYARDRGKFREVHQGLFRAYFAEGRDIGDTAVLTEIVAAAGLDTEDHAEELARGECAEVVDRATHEARSRGYTSTPTMIFGERAMIPGAQDLEVYENLLARLEAPKKPGMS